MNHQNSSVGIVYSADGSPRVSPEFITHLTAEQRAFVVKDMAEHGYTLKDDNTVEKL